MKYVVYYRKNTQLREDPTLTKKDVMDLKKFAPVCVIEAESLDEVFSKMQGEIWSPNGEAKPLIKALELSHTSMSVGDVAVLGNAVAEVAYIDWNQIKE